jgi:hypothetical protein
LARKLGIRPGARVALLGAPPGFESTLLGLPAGVVLGRRLGAGGHDVIVLFAARRAELLRRLPAARGALLADGGLWIAWPKRSSARSRGVRSPSAPGLSGRTSDLSETEVRAEGLKSGLVDNKVCAIDAIWSGLRFVVRRRDRSPRRARPGLHAPAAFARLRRKDAHPSSTAPRGTRSP